VYATVRLPPATCCAAQTRRGRGGVGAARASWAMDGDLSSALGQLLPPMPPVSPTYIVKQGELQARPPSTPLSTLYSTPGARIPTSKASPSTAVERRGPQWMARRGVESMGIKSRFRLRRRLSVPVHHVVDLPRLQKP